MKNRAATVPLLVGRSPQEVRLSEHGVQLKLLSMDGNTQVVEADHVIAATGYKADVRRFPFLSSSIVEQLRLVGKTPKLSPNFESSIPGLYFVGQVSTTTFGPVMRFVFGTEFTSRMISRHLARMQPRSWREFPRRIAGQHQPTADIFSPEMPVDVHLEPTKRSQSSR
ncbi:MAG: hypothetical protein E5V73_00455 [Mesorhizobium sp.]|nr:MAG: hypothetical protein E5V73_00455 [Mesorhizobium sp.]